jgi:hypothetical protein
LAAGIEALGQQAYPIHYEKLVAEPEAQLRPLFDWLGLEFEPGLVE